jgi:putative DNA primase/helicase
MSEIREAARGRWHEILPAFGISSQYLKNKHGPCPMCGGRDRWRFDDKEGTGTFYCSQCGSGDGFMLLQKFSSEGFLNLSKQVEKIVHTSTKQPRQQNDARMTPEQALARCKTIWDKAEPVTEGSPVGKYHLNRFGRIFDRPSIRSGRMFHPDERREIPVMICKISDWGGKPANLHLTFLDHHGRKARVSPQRKILQGSVPEGGAIRLARGGASLGIAEGVETALSAEMLFGIPVWSAINTSILTKWAPPSGVEEITVFADNDLNYAGQSKAYALANRLSLKGFKVSVRVPPEPGQDWNDVLLKRKGAEAPSVISI